MTSEIRQQSSLNCEAPTVLLRKPHFELNTIFDPDFTLPFDPDSGIASVILKRIRVSWSHQPKRLIFEREAKDQPNGLMPFLNEILPPHAYPRHLIHITEAAFELTYHPQEGTETKRFTFKVSYPNTCSLKSKPDDQRMLGEICLKQWGIARE